MDAYEVAGEEAGRKLYKNVESSIKQVLATTPHETLTIRTLAPITKTIQVRRTRHAGHCWRSKDELISDVLLWTPTHGCARVGRPARTYIQQLCEDTGCNPEDLPEAMNDREKWRETVRDIRAGGATWWWWWLFTNVDITDMGVGIWSNSFLRHSLHWITLSDEIVTSLDTFSKIETVGFEHGVGKHPNTFECSKSLVWDSSGCDIYSSDNPFTLALKRRGS